MLLTRSWALISKTQVLEVAAFALVGGLATATHYLVALLLIERLGVGIYSANVAAYSTALGVSFFGHSLLTFRVALQKKVFLRFIGFSVVVFLFSQAILWLAQMAFPDSHRISMAIVVVLIPAVSYLVNKFLVYKP